MIVYGEPIFLALLLLRSRLDGIKGRLVEPDRSPDPYGPYGLGA